MSKLEKILSKKKSGNQYKYLIKWKDFPESHSTWETIDNLLPYIDRVEEFETNLIIEKNLIDLPRRKNNKVKNASLKITSEIKEKEESNKITELSEEGITKINKVISK